MYRHIQNYDIKYSDVDAYDKIKLSSLLSFLQESACLSADELGFGYSAVTPQNIAFIVVNYYIEFFDEIKLGDTLCVHTWPLAPKHCIFLRDFELYCKDKKVGVATARWCMVDLRLFKLLPASAFFQPNDFDNYNTERSLDFNDFKIRPVSDARLAYSKKITFSDYDHYFHVNNAKYADFLIDVFSADELKQKRLKSVGITYTKQCKIGEELQLFRSDNGDEHIIEGKVNGEQRIIARIKFDEV